MAKLTDSERRVRSVENDLIKFLNDLRGYEPAKFLTPDEWAAVLGPIVESLTLGNYEVRRAEQ